MNARPKAVRVVDVIGPRRWQDGSFAVTVVLHDGQEGSIILPREQLLEFLELLEQERDRSPQERQKVPPLRPTVELDDGVPDMVPVARIELSKPVDPKSARRPDLCEVRFQDENGMGATLLLDSIGVRHWRDLMDQEIKRVDKLRN